MRKITSRKNTKKKFIAAAIIAAVLLCVAIWYFALGSNNRDDSTDSTENPDPAPARLNDAEAEQKREFIEETEASESENSNNSSNPDNSSTTKASVTLDIQRDGSDVVIISKISGINDGSCKLKIKNGTKTYTESADVMFQPIYSSCAGFSVAKNELGNGTWIVSLDVTSRDGLKASASSTKEVE